MTRSFRLRGFDAVVLKSFSDEATLEPTSTLQSTESTTELTTESTTNSITESTTDSTTEMTNDSTPSLNNEILPNFLSLIKSFLSSNYRGP